MKKDAILSTCNQYRYSLSRIWDESKPMVGFIGLNPSTADHLNDDKTILRCIAFASEWGFGGFYMMNLFAYRATNPSVMMKVNTPVGCDNDQYLLNLKNQVEKIVVCWGNDGCYRKRSKEVLNLLNGENLYCIDINKTGEPKHPLYIKNNKKLTPYLIS